MSGDAEWGEGESPDTVAVAVVWSVVTVHSRRSAPRCCEFRRNIPPHSLTHSPLSSLPVSLSQSSNGFARVNALERRRANGFRAPGRDISPQGMRVGEGADGRTIITARTARDHCAASSATATFWRAVKSTVNKRTITVFHDDCSLPVTSVEIQ